MTNDRREKNGLRGGLPSPVLPGSGPGGRRSASELSPASQPFLPAPGLPGTPFGPAPSITSQTIFTLHGANDGRLGPKAPACTGQTPLTPAQVNAAIPPCTRCPVRRSRPPAPDPPGSAQSGQRRKPAASRDGGVHALSRTPPARSFTGGRRIRPVENRFSGTRPAGVPTLILSWRRVPEKGVEKPECLTTAAPPFSVRLRGDADPGPASPLPMRTTRSPPSRRTWPARLSGTHVSTSGQILDRQARALTEAGSTRVFAGRQPGKTAGRPGLAACLDYLRAGDTSRRAEPGPAVPGPAGPDHHRGRAAPPRHRVPVPARGAGHHHPGRPAGLPASSRPWPSSSGDSSWRGSRCPAPRPGSTARRRRCRPGLPRTGRPGPRRSRRSAPGARCRRRPRSHATSDARFPGWYGGRPRHFRICCWMTSGAGRASTV